MGYLNPACVDVKSTETGYDANCKIYMSKESTGAVCHQCKLNFVLEAGVCKSSSTLYEKKCRLMAASVCTGCMDGLHFKGKNCLSAKLAGFAFIALAALFFN